MRNILRLSILLSTALPALAYRDLETGVFLNPDPAGFIDGPNLYAYVNANPWTKFDPEGLDPAFASDIGMFQGLNSQQTVQAHKMGTIITAPIIVGAGATAATGGLAGPPIAAAIGEGTTATLTTAAVAGATGGATSQVTSNVMTGQPVTKNVAESAIVGAGLNVAGGVLGQTAQAFNQGVRDGQAIATATSLANQTAANGGTAGAANAIVAVDGTVVTGLSKNAGGGAISPEVASMYGTSRTTCAEARSLTQAQNSGVNLQGGDLPPKVGPFIMREGRW